MDSVRCKLWLSVLLAFSIADSAAQDVQLMTEDFENGGLSMTLNSGGPGSNSGTNFWLVNNNYSGAPTYPNTTTQDNTVSGTIGFAPTSNYLHIHNSVSGITNANYDPGAVSDQFAYISYGICTYGMEDVHFSFFYLCEGSPGAYGTVYYSADSGPWTQIGQSQYINTPVWEYEDITDPNFTNVGSLRFGFRWQNDAGAPPYSQSFAIDDINIVASYATVDPITISVTSVGPSPVCQGNFITINFAFSDTLCDGNYQIQLSNSAGNFPSPYGSWVMPVSYPQTTGSVSVPLPNNAPPGDCYRVRINRLSPPPAITGIASECFSVIECPNVITTLQPVVTLDTNAVCVGSAIDIPFNSTGVYSNNTYIAQLSDVDGTFPSNPEVVGSIQDSNTYDPMLGQLPGSVSGLVPLVDPGCNYYIRIISTNPDAIGSVWGPFCIQQCDISTNNFQDLFFCVNDCEVDPDGENQPIDIDVNTYDNTASYLPGNVFTTQLLSSIDFSQIGQDGILGSVAATGDTQLDIHIPCKDSLDDYGIPLGMNYFRVNGTQSTDPDNSLGSLIRLTIGAYRNEPQLITSYEYPSGIPKSVFCLGETVMLTFNPYNYFDNSTYMWSCNQINGGQPFVSPSGANSNSLFVILGAPGVLTFSIQETNNGCVSPWTPITEVTALGPPNINISGPTSICEADTNTYQVQFTPNTYYSWDTSSFTDQIAYQDTSNNVMNIAFNGTGSHTFTLSVLNLCGSDTDSHTVNVLPLPEVGAEPDTLVCTGDPVSLSTLSSPTYTYSWSDGSTILGSTNPLVVNPEEDTFYVVTVTGAGGCEDRDTVLVEVQLPDPATAYFDELCPGGLNQLDLFADTTGTYEWSTGSSAEFITVTDTGYYSLSVQLPGEICPRLTDYFVVPAEPDAAIQYTDSICPGGLNELTLSADTSGNYLWDNGATSYSILVSDTGTYSLAIYNENEICPRLVDFNVLPMLPDPPIQLTDSVCPGGRQPIMLQSGIPGQHNWSTGDSGNQILVNDTGIYVLTTYGAMRCPETRIFTVTPDTCIVPEELIFHVPNSFTLNADALNDAFGPVFSDVKLISEYEFLIFNRWGEMVFESRDPEKKWYGNFRKGEYFVIDDVYVWKLEFRQEGFTDRREAVGHVCILR